MRRAARRCSLRHVHAPVLTFAFSHTALGIPLATLAGLRDGSLVAVPRKATREMLDAMRRPLDPEFSAGLTVFRGIYRAMVAAAEAGDE